MQVPSFKLIVSMPELKNRSCDLLGRLTCNLFQSHFSQQNESQPRNVLERRTIDSRQISTISSLVDKKGTVCEEGDSKLHDSQKENFGLYALKYNRSSASKRGKPVAGSRSSVTNQNHEHFQPCRSSSIDSNSQPGVDGEYCEIDLTMSDDSDARRNEINRMEFARKCEHSKSFLKNSQNNMEDGVKKNSTVMAPEPPKRIRNISRHRQQPQKLDSSFAATANNRKSVNKSTHLQRHKLMTHNHSGQLEPIKQNNNIQSVGEQIGQIKLRKNQSELYRIAGSNSRINDPNNKYPPRKPCVRQQATTRRKLLRHNQSSVKSVDIFKSTNESNVFDDFDEVLQVAPIVAVANDQSYVTTNQSKNESKKSSRTTIKKMEMDYRSRVSDTPNISRDQNANSEYTNTWKISADSNEITIYSSEKFNDELGADEEIIV